MGLSLGEEDERFGCHEKYYEQAEESGDIHVIENVPEYPVKSMVDRFLNHGDENGPWKCEYAQVDPRLFGFSTARPRVYGLAWNSNVVQWDPKFEFLEILECLKAQPCMEAKDYFWMSLPKPTMTPADETYHK